MAATPTTIFVTAGAALMLLCGCTRYLERETPPGRVPPPPPQTVQPTKGTDAGEQRSEAAQSDEREPTADAQPQGDPVQMTMDRFTKAYSAKGNPRIAVFLNRELSDDVREWQSEARAVIAMEAQATTQRSDGQGKATDDQKAQGAVAGYIERPVEAGDRKLDAAEGWKWAFEDGFIQPFLRAKTRIVDRATIMRLAAAKAKPGAVAPVGVKQVEMDALKDSADVFVEVLISRSPASPYGYEFKATAKEVNTGIVLANVTSLGWNQRQLRGRTVIATSDGYKIKDSIAIPQVQEVAAHLGTDLMGDLAQTWTK